MKKFVTIIVLFLSAGVFAQSSGYALEFANFYSGDNNQAVFANGYDSGPVSTQVDNVTLEAWVKWYGESSVPVNEIIAYTGRTGLDGFGITLDQANGNKVSLHVGVPSFVNASALTPGAWTHVAIVRNSGNWKIFFNGTGTAAGSAAPTAPSKTLKVGNNEAINWGFHGVIDEVRLSNVARYADDFTPQNTPFVNDGNTIVLYHFDEGSGTSANDASSNNNDGVLGRTSLPQSIPTWILGDAPLPVMVQSFTAKRVQDNVSLEWTTSPITEPEIFTIQRAVTNDWTTIGTIEGNPGDFETFSYTDDVSILPADLESVRYRLVYINPDGVTSFSAVQVVSVKTPESAWLAQNHPNPFNPSTLINYALNEQSHVKLTLYNCLGQQVQTLVDQEQGAGEYSVNFNAMNLPGGVYFYKLESGNAFVDMKKMVLIK